MFEDVSIESINPEEMDEDTRRGYEAGLRMGRALLSQGAAGLWRNHQGRVVGASNYVR